MKVPRRELSGITRRRDSGLGDLLERFLGRLLDAADGAESVSIDGTFHSDAMLLAPKNSHTLAKRPSGMRGQYPTWLHCTVSALGSSLMCCISRSRSARAFGSDITASPTCRETIWLSSMKASWMPCRSSTNTSLTVSLICSVILLA